MAIKIVTFSVWLIDVIDINDADKVAILDGL